MKITAIIEKAKDGGISIFCKGIKGAYGYGLTEDEAKADFAEMLEEQAEYHFEKNGVYPEWKDCDVEYIYDISGFFEAFPFINASEFARTIGINPALMRRYKNGMTYASEKQRANIQEHYNRLVKRMSSVKF